jgi:hypothetical protein
MYPLDLFPVDRAVTEVVGDFLELGSLKPFSQLSELSTFASNQVYLQPTPPRVAWNQDMTRVSVDGEEVSLEDLRAGLKEKVKVLQSLIQNVTGQEDIPDWLQDPSLGSLTDDPRESLPGYGFLKDKRFQDAHIPVLEHLVDHPDWSIGELDNEGRWMWNIPAILRLFSTMGTIQETLLLLIRIVSSNRGTELSDTKISNSTSRLRNLNVHQGRLYNNGAYSKTTELMQLDSYLPCLLPEEISRPLVHYLATIRPIEQLLSRQIWDDSIAALYPTYLFLSCGRRLTSKDDSQILKEFFEKYCRADIGLNRWRQASASLRREFIDDYSLSSPRRSDVGMGHSTALSRRHYGQDQDTPSYATADALLEQSWVDSQFHALLGFSSCPPPTALRLRKSDDAIQKAVSLAIKEGIKDERGSLVEELLGGIGSAVREEVGNVMKEEVRRAVREEVQSTMRDEVRSAMREEFRMVVREEVKSLVREEVRRAFRSEDGRRLSQMEPSISPPGEEQGQSADQSADILVPNTSDPLTALLPSSPSSQLSYFSPSPSPPRQEEDDDELQEGGTPQGPTWQAGTNKRRLEADSDLYQEEGNDHHLRKRLRTIEVHSEQGSIPDSPAAHTSIMIMPEGRNKLFFSQKKLRPLERAYPLPTRNIGPAIVQGAFLNRQPVEEMRKKSHRLNKIMPAMQGICPACFILTGKRVKSLPVGSKGAGADESQHIPFKHCQFPQSRCPNMWEFISFRKMIKLKGGFHYCFSCGMPQNKNRNGLEPKCHEDWGENCSRAKLNTPVNPGTLVKGVCPWSGIIQASLFALFHDKMAMKALKEPPIGLQDPDQMSLAQWASWLNKDESEKGEYWKGLEVFLFKMAEYGYKGI